MCSPSEKSLRAGAQRSWHYQAIQVLLYLPDRSAVLNLSLNMLVHDNVHQTRFAISITSLVLFWPCPTSLCLPLLSDTLQIWLHLSHGPLHKPPNSWKTYQNCIWIAKHFWNVRSKSRYTELFFSAYAKYHQCLIYALWPLFQHALFI